MTAPVDILEAMASAQARVAEGPGRKELPDGAAIDGAQLLKSLQTFVRRFVVMTFEQAVVSAVWILHTFAIEAFDVTPYLAIISAEKRSGKSRLLEVLGLLSKNPWHAIQPSEAVLFRYIEAHSPTLLLDETDALFTASSSDRQEAVRALLNAGNRRGVTVPRCANHGKELIHFKTFCPKALAGIGDLPDTVRDRSFRISMRRKKRSEEAARFRVRDVQAEAEELRDRAEAWALHHLDSLAKARPALPSDLGDRAQDGAEPLLAIADLAGGSWPEDTRRALIELAGEQAADDDPSHGIELLTDCRSIIETLRLKDGHIKSDLLRSELLSRPDSRWKTFQHGEALDMQTLAKKLRPYDVRPKVFKNDGVPARGYRIAAFLDAFERYLPPVQSDEPEDEAASPPVTTRNPETTRPGSGASGYRVPVTSPVTDSAAQNSDFPVTGTVTGRALPLDPRRKQSVTGLHPVTGTQGTDFGDEPAEEAV